MKSHQKSSQNKLAPLKQYFDSHRHLDCFPNLKTKHTNSYCV